MDVLWRATSALTVRSVLDQLPAVRGLAYTTVMTVLDRLTHKGFVSREKVGKAYAYVPRFTAQAWTAGLMAELLRGIGESNEALVHFARLMSADEVAALRRALTARPR